MRAWLSVLKPSGRKIMRMHNNAFYTDSRKRRFAPLFLAGKRERYASQKMRLIDLCLCVWLSAVASTAAFASCTWEARYVSAIAKPQAPHVISSIPKDATIRVLVDRLGPAIRDVGSGMFVLEWELQDGRIFSASARDACAPVLAMGIRKSNGQASTTVSRSHSRNE